MHTITSTTVVATAARAHDITLFASLELSKSKWVVTINSPGSEKFSRHLVEGGDGDPLSRPRGEGRGALWRAGQSSRHSVWIHRLLIANGIESQVVDAASIAVLRRHRRAKTDSIDGQTLFADADDVGARRVAGLLHGFARRARKKRIAGA